MKKKLICAPLLCGGLAQASGSMPHFEGALRFANGAAGVRHALVISGWQVDRSGVPSFDYSYEQRAGKCRFQVSGRAVGVYDMVKGKVELAVFNPQDEHGVEMPPVVAFEDDTLSLSLRADGTPRRVALVGDPASPRWSGSCAKRDANGLRVVLRR